MQPKSQPMRVITIASAKGGSTKTSITAALVVRASKESKKVAMIDLNSDQASLTQWWMARGEPSNPQLFQDPDNLAEDIDLLRKEQWQYCFIDTPPLDVGLIETAIAASDVVVIPVRTSMLDVGSIDSVVEMCRLRRKPFAFLLSAVDSRSGFKQLTAAAAEALAEEGPVFETRVSYRLPYINAMTVGKVGSESDKDLKEEIDSLWAEVKMLATQGKTAVKGRV